MFSQFDLHPNLARAVREMGFEEPTPIQARAIPPGIEGRDLLACAMTGTGKTAAFLLPALQRLQGRRGRAPRALVVVPTRELAVQVLEQLDRLAAYVGLRGVAVYGGVSGVPQERAIRSGVDILVATPGRLLDHLQGPFLRLDELEILVLDEADRMLDMGFLPDVRRILRAVPAQRQTMLFSATMPQAIVDLTKELLRDPIRIEIDRKAAPATGVNQSVYPVGGDAKARLLVELVSRGDMRSVLAFTRTKHRANRLHKVLEQQGISAGLIHGNRSQAQRQQALDGFKAGRCRVLVATDIAARGIDIDELSHVVNFDVPHVPEDYIHRVGRTARAQATGDAFTFVSPDEERDLRAIERAIGRSLPRVKLDGFAYDAKTTEPLEIPLAQRIAAIRERKAQERARRSAKEHARTARPAAPPPAQPQARDRAPDRRSPLERERRAAHEFERPRRPGGEQRPAFGLRPGPGAHLGAPGAPAVARGYGNGPRSAVGSHAPHSRHGAHTTPAPRGHGPGAPAPGRGPGYAPRVRNGGPGGAGHGGAGAGAAGTPRGPRGGRGGRSPGHAARG